MLLRKHPPAASSFASGMIVSWLFDTLSIVLASLTPPHAAHGTVSSNESPMPGDWQPVPEKPASLEPPPFGAPSGSKSIRPHAPTAIKQSHRARTVVILAPAGT